FDLHLVLLFVLDLVLDFVLLFAFAFLVDFDLIFFVFAVLVSVPDALTVRCDRFAGRARLRDLCGATEARLDALTALHDRIALELDLVVDRLALLRRGAARAGGGVLLASFDASPAADGGTAHFRESLRQLRAHGAETCAGIPASVRGTLATARRRSCPHAHGGGVAVRERCDGRAGAADTVILVLLRRAAPAGQRQRQNERCGESANRG